MEMADVEFGSTTAETRIGRFSDIIGLPIAPELVFNTSKTHQYANPSWCGGGRREDKKQFEAKILSTRFISSRILMHDACALDNTIRTGKPQVAYELPSDSKLRPKNFISLSFQVLG